MEPNKEKTPDIAGVVEDVVYRNPANDYVVLELIDSRTGILETAVGTVPYAACGEYMELFGTWKEHPDYGKQLQIEHYEKRLPASAADILRYLSSHTVKGIGPSTALKIVNRFGTDTFEVIEKHPEWLADIPGITRKKAASIAASFAEQAKLRELMTLCAGHIGNATVSRVFREWGSGAADILRRDPYRLCRGGMGVGFERADEIAASLGIGQDSEIRIRAGISYVLSYQASVNGHTCLPREKLIPVVSETLSLDPEPVTEVLDRELREGEVVVHRYEEQDLIFSREFDRAENEVAEGLLAIARRAATFDHSDLMNIIERMEREWGISYAPKQREAIGVALNSGVMILTGGPGTGKTTIIRALIRIFEILGMDTALTAPTGRAAKRMSDATVHEAKTVHRLLEMAKNEDVSEPRFMRNRDHPLDEMVVIVDESSMLDLPLTAALVRAVRRGGRLLFVGDADQLPAVGCGNILGDLIASEAFPTVCLTDIFRQGGESLIVENAHRIIRGEYPETSRTDSDFFFLPRQREESVPKTVESLLAERLPRAYGQEVVAGIQVITPTHRGICGTDALNQVLQARMNPPSPDRREIRVGSVVYREGDRIMQTRNHYDIEWQKGSAHGMGVFNGDLGVIQSIEQVEENYAITISFDDRIATYDASMLDEIEHAYAITVHKSQGSEYPTVVMPLYRCGPLLQTRNLLYTAMTRAKERLILVGQEEVLRQMVENERHIRRYTGLVQRIRQKCDKLA